jgi:hypothetical protein
MAEGGDSISSLGANFKHITLDFWIRIVEPWKEKVVDRRKSRLDCSQLGSPPASRMRGLRVCSTTCGGRLSGAICQANTAPSQRIFFWRWTYVSLRRQGNANAKGTHCQGPNITTLFPCLVLLFFLLHLHCIRYIPTIFQICLFH